MIHIYKVTIWSIWCNPLLTPLVSSPCQLSLITPFVIESLLLTWNPSFLCGGILIHPGPRLLVNWPPPPHSLFLPPTVPPIQVCTLLRRHHYTNFTWFRTLLIFLRCNFLSFLLHSLCFPFILFTIFDLFPFLSSSLSLPPFLSNPCHPFLCPFLHNSYAHTLFSNTLLHPFSFAIFVPLPLFHLPFL